MPGHHLCGRISVERGMSSQAPTRNTEAAILARVIQAAATEITAEVARYLRSM